MPTDKEMRRHVSSTMLKTLAKGLQTSCTTLAEVLHKVLEDVSTVATKRVQTKIRVRKHRGSEECNALPQRSCNATEKSIEENKREENKREENKDTNKPVKIPKIKYAENVTMTEEEYAKLVKRHSKFVTEKAIMTLDNYKGSSGKAYKSDYRTILSWVMDKVRKEHSASNGIQPDGKREERINREGLKKLKTLIGGVLNGKTV